MNAKLLSGRTSLLPTSSDLRQLKILIREQGRGDDRIYGTELSMVLNHKCWQHYNGGNGDLSKLYAELWGEFHDFVLDNWKVEDLQYYLQITD